MTREEDFDNAARRVEWFVENVLTDDDALDVINNLLQWAADIDSKECIWGIGV